MIAQHIEKSFERSFGTACFLTFFALLLFRHTGEMIGPHLPFVIIMGILFVVLFSVCAHMADRLDELGPARLSALACLLCVVGAFMLETLTVSSLSLVGGALVLLGCVAFFLILGKNLAFYNHEERICQLSSTFLMGAVFLTLAAALSDTTALVFLLLLPILTTLHLCALKPNKDTFSFADLAVSRENHKFSLTVLLTTAVTGFVWGIAFFLTARPFHVETVVPLYLALPLALGGLVNLIDLFKFKRISENSLLRCFATASFIAIAPLPFVPEWAQQLCGAYLFLLFSFDTIVCFSAMGEVARFNQISPYWVFGVSLAFYFAGAFVGYLGFGWAFAQNQNLPPLIVCFASLLLIIWCSNYVFQDSYPGSESIADLAEASTSLLKNESRPALWQRKIDHVIERYELTARQQEVFRMLVRGRNAQYVAEKFFISNSTAKAHIHNIYRKLDIHSQQELINLVENVECSMRNPDSPEQESSGRKDVL